jgi:protein pelota
MNIIKSDFKKGTVKLRITDPEDLWYLSHLIDPGDFVKGKTTRKVKIGEGDNAKVAKKTLILQIETEQTFYENNSLRVLGKIKEAPDYIPFGSYHSITLVEGEEFTLEKSTWLSYQKQKLKESTQKKYAYLLCLIDREEALFALTQKAGYDILLKIKGDVPKKGKDTEIKKDFHTEIIKTLEVYAGRYTPQRIILASPAFYKDDLYKKIKDKELSNNITLAVCSDVTESALDEVMKRPELKTILQDSRSREEKILVDELLQEIKKDNLAVYGWKEVLNAINVGAVSKLMLTDEFVKKKREEESFIELDEAMKSIDALKGEIHIISAENDAGKQLDGLGGIAAILRYKIR